VKEQGTTTPEEASHFTISVAGGQVRTSGLLRFSKRFSFQPARRLALMALCGGGAFLLGGHSDLVHFVQIGLGAAFGYAAHGTD
jgi:hypothetical protein